MNEAAKHKQTASFLRKRFDEAGIRPNTRHGQNFLIDLNILGPTLASRTITRRLSGLKEAASSQSLAR